MREIKFREVYQDDKAIYTQTHILGEPYRMHFGKYGELVGRDLYTGLKDKNGKEIYEGDIVKNELGELAEVKFSLEMGILSGFTFSHPDIPLGDFETEDEIGDKVILFEVIGNIYKNPELIKKA